MVLVTAAIGVASLTLLLLGLSLQWNCSQRHESQMSELIRLHRRRDLFPHHQPQLQLEGFQDYEKDYEKDYDRDYDRSDPDSDPDSEYGNQWCPVF